MTKKQVAWSIIVLIAIIVIVSVVIWGKPKPQKFRLEKSTTFQCGEKTQSWKVIFSELQRRSFEQAHTDSLLRLVQENADQLVFLGQYDSIAVINIQREEETTDQGSFFGLSFCVSDEHSEAKIRKLVEFAY